MSHVIVPMDAAAAPSIAAGALLLGDPARHVQPAQWAAGDQFHDAPVWRRGDGGDLIQIGQGVRPLRVVIEPEGRSRWHVVGGQRWEIAEHEIRHIKTFVLPSIEALARARIDEVAAFKWQVMNGGLTTPDGVIPTDDSDRQMIDAAALDASTGDPAATREWKLNTFPPVYVEKSNAEVTAIRNLVGAFVQDCYSAERVHAEALMALHDAGDADGLIAYDATGADGWAALLPDSQKASQERHDVLLSAINAVSADVAEIRREASLRDKAIATLAEQARQSEIRHDKHDKALKDLTRRVDLHLGQCPGHFGRRADDRYGGSHG